LNVFCDRGFIKNNTCLQYSANYLNFRKKFALFLNHAAKQPVIPEATIRDRASECCCNRSGCKAEISGKAAEKAKPQEH
jgi:hypothetical protein